MGVGCTGLRIASWRMILIIDSRRRVLLIWLGAIVAVAAITYGPDDLPVTVPTQVPSPTSVPQVTFTPAPVIEVPSTAQPPTAPVAAAPARTAAPTPTSAPEPTTPPSTGGADPQVTLNSENFDWLVEGVGV